jgi:tetratricopeptide (TPR) repeat protein
MTTPHGQPSFLDELKRRKTVRGVLLYLAGAWAALQVAEVVLPAFGGPESAMRVLVLLAAAGLPVATVLSWLFDLTPEGLSRASSAADVESATEMPWVTARTGAVVVVLVGISLVSGWWIGANRSDAARAPGVEISENLLAVFPFSVRGSETFDYLSEGIVDLVSVKLDGAGAISTVDPRRVIARLHELEVDPEDPESSHRLAAALGAGRFITGNVLEIGGRLTVTAYLHDTLQPEAELASGVRAGTSDQLFDVLDSLVVDLVTGTLSDGTDRLQRLATVTSSSLPAVKEYLQGEQLYRVGKYREAAESYDRAVALDSMFALAHYRKSIAADWIDAYDVRSSAERALELADRLPQREHDLMEALVLRRNGDGAGAHRAFEALAQRYPSDLEVLTQFGETVFHEGPRYGQSLTAAIEPFRRVSELEPRNLGAQLHLARLMALYDSVDVLRDIADHFATIAPDGERAMEVEAMYAFLSGDSVRQEGVREDLEGRDWFYRFYATHGTARFARDPFGAETLLDLSAPGDAFLEGLVPGLYTTRGEFVKARASLARLSETGDPSWLLIEAFVLTSGAMPTDSARLTALNEQLAGVDPQALYDSSWLPPYEDLSVDFFAYQRDYFRTLVLLQLDRFTEAVGLLDAMAARPDFPHLQSLKTDAEHSLRAEAAIQAGDPQTALTILRSMDYQIPHASTVQPLPDLVRSRFVRAELERQIGDRDVARRLYVGLDESWSPWDSYLRPLAYRSLGEMAEEDGDIAQAQRYYGLLLDHWRDPDPELRAARDEVRDRLSALGSSPRP